MIKKTLLKISIVGCVFFLLLVAACGSNSEAPVTTTTTTVIQTRATATPPATPVTQTETTPASTTAAIQAATTTTPTTPPIAQTNFAATVGSSGNPVNRAAQGDNLTTIHSAVDRPVAKFTLTTLNVSPLAKGVVYIQNDSANPQTLISDTADGFAPFTIAPYSTTDLVFHRIGTFKAHLKDYPISPDTAIMIIITIPSPD